MTFPTAFWLSSTEDTFSGYTNWLSPTYAPTTNPSRLPIEMWNLASFSAPNNHSTLIFYLYGPLSTHILSLLSPTNKILGPLLSSHILVDFFTPYISLLPNYDAQKAECEPAGILCTKWQEDELAGNGSYMNVQTGCVDAKGDVEVVRRGVEERRLWFCGEHTAPFEELGTVGGAYLSGESVAGRIVELYKENSI